MTMAIKEKNEINLNSIKERLLVMPTESRYLYLVNKALAITGIHVQHIYIYIYIYI